MMEPQTLKEMKDYIFEHLPGVLERDPRFVTMVEGIVAEKFPRRDRFARLLDELRDLRLSSQAQLQEFRSETNHRFEQAAMRTDRLENEMRTGFHEVHVHLDRLGSRWGIRNEKLFRQTIEGSS